MGSALDEIKHVVVLMMENRSFDHLLGFLKTEFAPQAFEGLTGSESVPLDPRISPDDAIQVEKASTRDIYVTAQDPGHEFSDVQLQLYGRDAPVPAGIEPSNRGFVSSYTDQKGRDDQPVGPGVGRTIMRCLDPQLVPVISTLARNFVVCDHWFASMPGPTWPNRFFVHAATSGGHVESPTNGDVIRSQFLSPYRFRTIYENLSEAAEPKTWKIYFHDQPQSFAIRSLHQYVDHFLPFDRAPDRPTSFLEDAAGGTLPNYSFIEPQYFWALGNRANDQHPPHDLQDGEALIATVYDALRGNEDVWKRCLFVLLYDEHGGFYDHVPPGVTVNPDGINSPTPSFNFTRLGLRVPAILISPWVPRGLVDPVVYDHTSLLATVKKLFGLQSFLTLRDALANTFEHNFLSEPRPLGEPPTNLADLVRQEPSRPAPPADQPPSSNQKSLLALRAAVEAEGIASPLDRGRTAIESP